MIGLMILGAAVLYLAVAVLAVVAVMRIMRSSGASTGKRRLAGASVGLIFYLIPFWDWIPTVAAHRYYCAKEAKFDVYKSIEQWKTENADVAGQLRRISPPEFSKAGEYRRYLMNQRIAIDSKTPTSENRRAVFLSVRRLEGKVIDRKDEQVLAHYVDFSAGPHPGALSTGGEDAWKFWLSRVACDETPSGYWAQYSQFQQRIQEMEEKLK